MTSVLCVDTDQKKHMALIGLAVAGRSVPWSRRTGASEASATDGTVGRCRAVCNGLPTMQWSPRTNSPCDQLGRNGTTVCRVILTVG
jgi:hypothetical protein